MKKIELYIHIPFCVRKCNYCDFLSKASDQETKDHYVKALVQEIESSKSDLAGYEVISVFFGGGTPSLLSEEHFRMIMEALRSNARFTKDCEITVECNPGTVNKSLLRTYLKLGVNRLSFGLQSTNNEELKLLGRIHTYEQFCENYEMARNLGFTNINIDLMSALPKQTLKQYEETFYKVVGLNPEHISAYSLIIEEGTTFYQWYGEHGTRVEELPSVELDRLMYERTKEILHDNGYERYEISNYAKKGYECRHNVGYWTRVEYLGFGLGASSLFQNHRFQNESEMENYLNFIQRGETVRREVEQISLKDAMEEFMFLGLRMCEGVSFTKFEQSFGVPMRQVYGKVIDKLLEEKVIIIENDRLRLTEYGLDVSNAVFTEFILE